MGNGMSELATGAAGFSYHETSDSNMNVPSTIEKGARVKIKLIAPHDLSPDTISSAQTFAIQKANLPLLAALTPTEHTVTIVDEVFAADDTSEDMDLVGITVMTDLALRAYQIADAYRKRGIKVVIGGIHATVLPGEALQHADAVVVGEAEIVWRKLLSDATSGNLQKLYRADTVANLTGMPVPRRDLYPKRSSGSYIPLTTGIETGRGCPFNCEFCSTGSVMGRQYRMRPTAEVIAEIASAGNSNLFLVDDALAVNRPAARRLFEEMIPLGLKWAGQGYVALAEDLDLLRLMKRSGCVGLLVGFESVQKDPAGGMPKITNLHIDFEEAVRRFHGEGIALLGAFIFGFDQQTPEVFDQTFEFSLKNRLDAVELRILTPFPGTRLYSRLLKEGRMHKPDWWLHGYPADTLLFLPKGMTPDQLVDGFVRLNRQIYSVGAIFKRFFAMNPKRRGAFGCSVYAGLNLATRRRYLRGIDIPQPFVDRAESNRDLAGCGSR
jgi:radical SAM superfamily enzyme YgiQ (UPF0313 family)